MYHESQPPQNIVFTVSPVQVSKNGVLTHHLPALVLLDASPTAGDILMQPMLQEMVQAQATATTTTVQEGTLEMVQLNSVGAERERTQQEGTPTEQEVVQLNHTGDEPTREGQSIKEREGRTAVEEPGREEDVNRDAMFWTLQSSATHRRKSKYGNHDATFLDLYADGA